MARNRVEITGINTSDLIPIKNERMMEILPLAQKGDEDAREELVHGNLKLVLSVVKKFNNRKENLDDIFQVGCLGLLKAIDNFDFSHGVRFSTYAVPMIIGEIRRYLRDNSPIRISRSLKDIAYKALQFKEKYINEYQKEPTIEMIANELGEEEIDVVVALEAMQEPLSIYTPIYNNGSDEIYLIDQIGDEDDPEEKNVLKMTIEQGLKRLNQRERDIINKRYFLDKTQMAKEKGVSDIIVDVGIGFGKSNTECFELLNRIEEFYSLHLPLMIGISRKSFLGVSQSNNNDLKDSLSLAVSYPLIQKKVDFLRVHNVKLHKQLLDLAI